eukprot:8666428-Prorocentrum_lima.AAC.1
MGPFRPRKSCEGDRVPEATEELHGGLQAVRRRSLPSGLEASTIRFQWHERQPLESLAGLRGVRE